MTFGSTLVDGEHFSFLSKEGKLLSPSPIVMTVPTAPEGFANIIVGENLVDFLSLGYRVHFAALPALAYQNSDRSKLITDLVNGIPCWEGEDPSDEYTVTQIHLSKTLEKEIELKPWDNVEDRLAYLESQYFHFLEMKS
jgi:hypothetical protein